MFQTLAIIGICTFLRMANFANVGGDHAHGVGGKSDQKGSGINNYVASLFDPTLSWKDVEWLRSFTRLPIVLKGILRADDAVKAARAGATAVVVSNHGARQLDYVPATVDVLPAIVAAVGHQLDVYVDGGVTCGTDALKCLALGAKFVFVGRPALWGLAWRGQVSYFLPNLTFTTFIPFSKVRRGADFGVAARRIASSHGSGRLLKRGQHRPFHHPQSIEFIGEKHFNLVGDGL